MSKPYVEAKFGKLKQLQKALNLIQTFDYQDCRRVFLSGKKELVNNIYKQIAEVAAE